jgi:Amt family ammonium transporter
VVLAGLLILLGHAGFALCEAGLTRAKNASHAMTLNALVWALGILGFSICGFAFLCGGFLPTADGHTALVHLGSWGILGKSGLFLHGISDNSGLLLLFFLMACRVSIAASIPTGALGERWRFKSFFIFAMIMGGVLVPVFGCWIWGGGWLSQLGSRLGWGHGGVDYAGSAVIHLLGGAVGLVCAILLGPRIGKFDARGRPRPIMGHHVPMAILGSLILLISLLAMNVSPSIAAADGRLELVLVNSLLSAAAAATAACLLMAMAYGKPDPTMICDGMLAGVVAIAASCAFVDPWAAIMIGVIAGMLVVVAVPFWERFGVDDPCGVISVHGLSGLWGILALGFFANGKFGQSLNGGSATHGVAGLFYGDGKQLLSQLITAMACIVWSGIAGGLAFALIGKMIGSNRVQREVEMVGLDIPELGVPAYQQSGNSMPSGATLASEPRPASQPVSSGGQRFSIIVEGVDSPTLIGAWSALCQVSERPPSDEFRQVYPYLTTVTGNRFRFRGGDPSQIKENLNRLFESAIPGKAIGTRIEG